jgi:hypothetical protein
MGIRKRTTKVRLMMTVIEKVRIRIRIARRRGLTRLGLRTTTILDTPFIILDIAAAKPLPIIIRSI